MTSQRQAKAGEPGRALSRAAGEASQSPQTASISGDS
jgi:hypothetical protein